MFKGLLIITFLFNNFYVMYINIIIIIQIQYFIHLKREMEQKTDILLVISYSLIFMSYV